MSEKFISSIQIEKLGHKIQEIRERALLNIISKLDSGALFDNDLARSKELLNKLFKWFLFEPCSQEEAVFTLLERIIKSGSGKVLLNHCGKQTLEKEIDQLQTYIEPKYYHYLEKLRKIITKEQQLDVPPLETNIPLSYRSDTSSNLFTPNVETTATPMEGAIHKGSSVEQQTGAEHSMDNDSDALPTTTVRTYRVENDNHFELYSPVNCLPNYYFKWQPLVDSDRHVLDCVTTSLTDPPQPATLLHTCEFFTNVLIHDFPAEIFLQRSDIVSAFYSLANCGSKRVTYAVLRCLNELTRSLRVRLYHCNDVSMQSLKLEQLYEAGSAPHTSTSSVNTDFSNRRDKFESLDEINALQKKQLSTPEFCFNTIRVIFDLLCIKHTSLDDEKINVSQNIVNMSINLLEEVLELIFIIIRVNIWDQTQTEMTRSVLRCLNDIFSKYGEALEYFRLESATCETNLKYRSIYLYLVHHATRLVEKLVPKPKIALVLPRVLKLALSNCLLDVTFARLYPEVHVLILSYVECFTGECEALYLKKYKDVKRICEGMTSTVQFLKHHKDSNVCNNIKLALESIPSLEFHKDMDFIKGFIDFCANNIFLAEDPVKLSMVEEAVLSLLSHHMQEIREETYKTCHRKVVTTVGPKLSMSIDGEPGSQILFLLTSKILTEIAAFGMNEEKPEIQQYSEDIISYILKCKILVSDTVWNRVIQALIPSLPVIACHCKRITMLGKTFLNITDPDTAKALFLPQLSILKSNLQLLFSEDAYLRDEGFSRICWLLSSQENARALLPKFSSLYDPSLANICRLKRIIDVNKLRRSEHFYQPSSLQQVMDVLSSSNIEPVIRRSALNQVSVMLEDPLLHQIFLNSNGLEIIIEIMKTALTDNDYRDYPDSIIPIISVLKNLCLYHESVREEIGNNIDVFYCVLRGLFLFFTEDRLKQDAVSLLFIMIFKHFLRGSPSNGDFSFPSFITEKLMIPFQCAVHWKESPYTKENLRDLVMNDRWCLSCVRVQWNCEVFGGFQELVKWESVNYDDHSLYNIEEDLKLNNYELKTIKLSSIDYCIKFYLNTIQNGTSHSVVLESVENLTLYVMLYKLTTMLHKDMNHDSFLSHPWEMSFVRFIKALPSCVEDAVLLKNITNFFALLVPIYNAAGKHCWIVSFLKDPSQCLLDLLIVDSNTEEETKTVGQEMLKLITVCTIQEQHYLDYYTPDNGMVTETKMWTHVIKTIVGNLKFSDAQHFYNLAYLDSLLSCLVHLTANLGWSESKPNTPVKPPIPDLVASLCDLVNAFHTGKGPSAAVSVMGLSITRNVVLVLNHLVAEMLNGKAKGWELCFLNDVDSGSILRNLVALWASRDVVLRAAALQLFASLATSPRAVIEIVNEVKLGAVFEILINHIEASIVRENAAQFVANLISHSAPLINERASSVSLISLKKSFTMDFFNTMDEFNLYSNLDIVLSNLYTLTFIENCRKSNKSEAWSYMRRLSGSECSWESSSSRSGKEIVTTPALLKAFGCILLNMLSLNSEYVSSKLQEHGLVKLLFRALCNPTMSISNTRALSLYCDILEMNTIVCSVLSRLSSYNPASLGTILHTKDCFNCLLSLLDSRIYSNDFPQLIYLRNKLWTNIFNLISTLVVYSGDMDGNLTNRSLEAASIFSDTILELGNRPFFEAICESLSCLGSNELQNSALTSLTCLLRVETYRAFQNLEVDSPLFRTTSMQSLLDSVRTTKTVVITETNKENIKPKKPSKRFIENQKIDLLEELYFDKMFKRRDDSSETEIDIVESQGEGDVCGGEICKILLYLYDICDLKSEEGPDYNKKRSLVNGALSSLLCVSREAKKIALEKGLVLLAIKQLRERHMKLSLESVDSLRRLSDKKRVCPMLKEVHDLVGLLTNFMLNDEHVKMEAATLNLADVVHKLWVWFLAQSVYLADVMKMLCIYTTDCNLACQTLPLTSPVAGSGPRKSPSNVSLLHAVINLINKQMDLISKTHELTVLEASFNLLINCCESLECRVLMSKSNLLQSMSRLHPAITKRQKPWDDTELLWLRFLLIYTGYPEGQASVAKVSDILELVMVFTSGSRLPNKKLALSVLRNLAFHQPNRPRLLSSGIKIFR
ncbi:unnamed protein product [Acanthoscelides obtectus]|uniref:Rotatin N-terminal domain-containing protein n=1 Tax=Acanthoscelides obtectus TaxID=200917 RepID=A0A9P0JIP6_ACAOB|nr:unnamed protein product [Acanthoscelides obtectus]CAK1625032.1 Rotatin [Acanthoscelides obtectus]